MWQVPLAWPATVPENSARATLPNAERWDRILWREVLLQLRALELLKKRSNADEP